MNNQGRGLRGQLLGDFALTTGGVQLKQPGRKTLALMAFLAVRGEPVSRAELTELLWADGRLVDLRQLLPKVRRWLPDTSAFTVTPTEVSLNIATDAVEFEQLIDSGDYSAALSLWPVRQRGGRQREFLAGLVAPTQLYADWLARERAYFEALRQEALLAYGMQLEGKGELAAAAATYRDLLVLDPLAEEAQRGLMRVALRNGEVQQALEQYELFLQRLRRVFDVPVEPLPETVSLAAQLRLAAGRDPGAGSHSPELAGAATRRLPEISHLESLIRLTEHRVVTVTVAAPGRSGNTAQVLQVALRWGENERAPQVEGGSRGAAEVIQLTVAGRDGSRLIVTTRVGRQLYRGLPGSCLA